MLPADLPCHMPMKNDPGNSTRRYSTNCCESVRPLPRGKGSSRFKNKLFSLDASVIELLRLPFRLGNLQTDQGSSIRAHLLLDHDGYLPVFAHVTEGNIHELNIARELSFPRGSIVAVNRGYTDYLLFARWTEEGVFFVTRQKGNADYLVVEERAIPQNRNILKDQIITFNGYIAKKNYPYPLRRIKVWDDTNRETVVLITNHLVFGATTIAAIYKDRWQIEIFFKTIKQKIKDSRHSLEPPPMPS